LQKKTWYLKMYGFYWATLYSYETVARTYVAETAGNEKLYKKPARKRGGFTRWQWYQPKARM